MSTAANTMFGPPQRRKATRTTVASLAIVVALLATFAIGRYSAARGTMAPRQAPVEVDTRYAPQDTGVAREGLRMTATRWLRPAICAAPAVTCVFVAAPAADASRADSYYTVVCHTPDGSEVAESVDAWAVQDAKTLGGKAGAVEHFNAHFPFEGWHCELTGPFNVHGSA